MSLLIEFLGEFVLGIAERPFGRWIKRHKSLSATAALLFVIAFNVVLMILMN